jgi:hypothetical protein
MARYAGETPFQLSHIQRGTLIHDILERFFKPVLSNIFRLFFDNLFVFQFLKIVKNAIHSRFIGRRIEWGRKPPFFGGSGNQTNRLAVHSIDFDLRNVFLL